MEIIAGMAFRFSEGDEGFRGEAELPGEWMARVSGTGVGAGSGIPGREWAFARGPARAVA